jgi:HEPN domain-containing protein
MASRSSSKLSPAKRHAAIENISVLGIPGRMGPLGLWIYADAFLTAAQALPLAEGRFDPVPYYLASHSVELSLKAVLALRGKSLLELSGGQFGHNLRALLAAAQMAGLSDLVNLGSGHLEVVETTADYYEGKVFEYPAVGEAMTAYSSRPNIDLLLAAASALVVALHEPCLTAVNEPRAV